MSSEQRLYEISAAYLAFNKARVKFIAQFVYVAGIRCLFVGVRHRANCLPGRRLAIDLLELKGADLQFLSKHSRMTFVSVSQVFRELLSQFSLSSDQHAVVLSSMTPSCLWIFRIWRS